MISSVPSYDDELLNGVFANICLIADKIWAFDPSDPFRKLNRTLWVQNCKLAEKCANGNYRPRRVRDTIPESRLAQYGDYDYDEQRERMYKLGDDTAVFHPPDLYIGDVTEPWMLYDVEKYFDRLSTGSLLPLDDELFSHLQSSTTEASEHLEKLTDGGTGRIWRSKWYEVLKKRYPTLASVLAGKNSSEDILESCSSNTTTPKETRITNVGSEDNEKYPLPRYTIDNVAEVHLQMRVTANAVRDIWSHSKPLQQFSQYSQRLYQQRQLQCDQQQLLQQQQQQHVLQYRQQQRLLLQCGKRQSLQRNQQQQNCSQPHQPRPGRYSSCPESIWSMHRPPPPILSAEVPEFFPKGPGLRSNGHREQSRPLQFFPSSTERSYQEELFPYNRGHVPSSGTSTGVPVPQPSTTSALIRCPQQWIQRPGPPLQVQLPLCPPAQTPLCSSVPPMYQAVIQRPVQIQEKIPQSNQVMSAPIPVYQRPPELYADPSQKRKNHGVDFNNLILLTKNAMKARRNQSKNPQQNSSFILESRQPNLKSEADVLQWLDKGFPRRAKEFVTVNTLVSDFHDFERKCECPETEQTDSEEPSLNANSVLRQTQKKNDGNAPAKRRLYRDVLTNSSSTGVTLDNVFDNKYDELERQATEQYRTSEECLALRYQELERQAMEQYKNCDNGAGNTTGSQGNRNSAVSDASAGEKQRQRKENVFEDKDCTDGHKCSGFGQCSPVKQPRSTNETGTPPQQKITILRPESKPRSGATHRGDINNDARPAALTKSLTTLNQTIFRESKNTIKSGSGDKNNRNVRALPKRRLILVSPLKREARARLTKTSNLAETRTFQTINRHVTASSYRKLRTGGGDEKVTILRSPGTGGIRKELFFLNEETMDGSSESLGVKLFEQTVDDASCVEVNLELRAEEHVRSVPTDKMDDGENCCAPWIEQQNKIPEQPAKNKKQCKPHEVIAVVEPLVQTSTAPSTGLLRSDKRCDFAKSDFSQDCIFRSATLTKLGGNEHRRKPLRSYRKTCFLENSIPETIRQCTGYHGVPVYDALKDDDSTNLVHDDLYLSKKELSSEKVHISIGNKWFLRVRYHEILSSTRNTKLFSNPYDVISLLYDSGRCIMLERLNVTSLSNA